MNAVANLRNSAARVLVLVGFIALAGSAFARSKGSMDLLHPASVGGTQLPAGNYTVQWDGNGDQVQLQVLQGKKTMATASAHVVKVEHPMRENSVMVEPSGTGQSVMRINFSKKDFALELDSEGAGSGAAGAGASK